MRLRSMQHIKNELEQLYQDIYKMNNYKKAKIDHTIKKLTNLNIH